jgi:dTMP kinase
VKNTIKIEFDGTDGSGKTTGLKYFIEEAKKRGLTVVETREVGNPNVPVCVKLRELVLDPNSNLSGEAMELIFSAMRFENDRWLSALKASGNAPDLVISDRGWFSHLAYTDHNVSKEFTSSLYTDFVGKKTSLPDVVIYFGVNTDTALARRVKRGEGMDVIEMKGVPFQEKVRESFADYLNEYESEHPQMVIFDVDANDTIEGVRAQLNIILNHIEEAAKSEKSA